MTSRLSSSSSTRSSRHRITYAEDLFDSDDDSDHSTSNHDDEPTIHTKTNTNKTNKKENMKSISFAIHPETNDDTHHNSTKDELGKYQKNDDDDEEEEEDDNVKILLSIQSELNNMGKALKCPICQATLRTPSLLPCLHAFCYECISTSLSTTSSSSTKSSSSSSSRRKKSITYDFKDKCPVCKTKCTKRSIVQCAHLADLVRGYKLSLRAFGFAPVVYDANLAMTQLEEDVQFSYNEEEEDVDDESKKLQISTDNIDNNILESTTSSNHNLDDSTKPSGVLATTKRKSSTSSTITTGSTNSNKPNMAPSLKQCHEHLEVTKTVHNALKKATILNNTNNDTNTNGTNNNNKKTTPEEMERLNQLKKLQILLQDQEKVIQADERALIRAAVSKHKKQRRSTDDDEQESNNNHNNPTNNNNSSSCKSDITNSMNTSDATNSDVEINVQSKSVNNGDDMHKNMISSQEIYEKSMEDAREKEAADRSGEFMLEDYNDESSNINDGNDAKKSDELMEQTREKEVSDKSGESFLPEKNEKSNNETFMSSQELYEKSMEDARENEAVDRSGEFMLEDNEGSNINLHEISADRVTCLDNVPNSNEPLIDDGHDTKQGDEKGIQKEKQGNTSDGHIYDGEGDHSKKSDLTEAEMEGVDESKERETGVKNRASTRKRTREESSNDRVATKSPSDAYPIKRRSLRSKESIYLKPRNIETDTQGDLEEKYDQGSLDLCKESASTRDEMSKLAIDRYSTILLGEDSNSKSKKRILNIVTSNLTDLDEDLMQLFYVEMKNHGVSIKELNDFNPKKTNLCVTSSTVHKVGKHQQNESKSRTLKLMRSAIAGIPILNSQWISSCLQNKKLVKPTDGMIINTLPTKSNVGVSKYGVTAIASEFQKCTSKGSKPSLLLENSSVFLCGKRNKSSNDIEVLVRDCGGKLLSSISQVVATINKMQSTSSRDSNLVSLVLLCDDTKSDKSSGITSKLVKCIQDYVSDKKIQSFSPIMVVHYNWLFDSISCGSILGGEAYIPLFPQGKELAKTCLKNI